jgi:hypothetical protein
MWLQDVRARGVEDRALPLWLEPSGIEATPNSTPTDSAVEAVMARVRAYREIKQQIEQARGAGA